MPTTRCAIRIALEEPAERARKSGGESPWRDLAGERPKQFLNRFIWREESAAGPNPFRDKRVRPPLNKCATGKTHVRFPLITIDNYRGICMDKL